MRSIFRARPPDGLADTLEIHAETAGASQSALAPSALAEAPGWLRGFGEGYFLALRQLPAIAVARAAGGWHVGLAPAPARLTLLRFAPPYLASARGGRELRYPIVGGLLLRPTDTPGHLAFGFAPEGRATARIWIDVVAYRPRLGLGPLYRLSQARLHRTITIAYLSRSLRP